MKTIRVQIAETFPSYRDGLADLVRKLGAPWQVCAVSATGTAAAEAAEELRPHVVILSHGHRGCDGLKTARDIRTRSRRTHVLLFTEVTSQIELLQIDLSAVAGAILKWESWEEVSFALEVVAAGHRFRSRAFLEACPRGVRARRRTLHLTQTELENLRLTAEGLTVKQIAAKQHVSDKTSATHRGHLLRKFGVRNAAGLTRCAIREGIVDPRGN